MPDPVTGRRACATTCKGLVALTLRCSNNAYLPLCRGLAGAIGALQVDPAHVPNPTEVPSEVRHLRRVDEDDGEEGEA